MFKLPEGPSARAPKHELADYAEWICWQQGSISITEMINLFGRLEENDYNYPDGVPEEDKIDEIVKEAYTEIERRKEACGGGYPFVLGKEGYSFDANQDTENCKHIIYKYLLLATRLNMKTNRVHSNIDGAELFEKLAAEVGREYLGTRAESLVFGTASSGKFEDKVNNLCKQMQEGIKYRGSNQPNIKDGKLDIVVWKKFTDRLPGKLIAFGQCKTGTNYKNTLTQLQPSSFCNKWLVKNLAVPPVRMFLISEALSRSDSNYWYDITCDAGLFFDRCRIIDFCNCDNIDPAVLKEVTTWTNAAAKAMSL